jgi:replicative DNA helicase
MNEEYLFISALLSKPEYLKYAVAKIQVDYLEDEFCRSIYQKMIEMENYTLPTLAKQLKINPVELLKIDEILMICNKMTFDGYCYVIFENYRSRAIKNLVSVDDFDLDKLAELKQMKFFDDKELNESDEFLKNVELQYQGKEDLRNIKTGFDCIDKALGGFRKSEAIFIGGRPGSGKTTLGMNIAYNMAKEKLNVLFCSLEMGAIELHERIVKSITKIDNWNHMGQSDFDKVIKYSKAVKERLPLKIYDKPGMTIEDIFYKCRNEKNLDVVFIDHLAILKSVKPFKSRYEEVSYISGRIKVLARELDIPVICLCQLNRALEGREIKAPTMADIRDSGSVEQDGDIIAFVYRPEYHLKDKEPDDVDSREWQEWNEEMQSLKGKANFVVAKNRRGFIGRLKLMFEGKYYLFYER